jgi:hypothetical protein
MKSKITPFLAERFAQSIQIDDESVLSIDAPAPDLGAVTVSPYVAGLKASHLSKRFSDNEPLKLQSGDWSIFVSLCRLRKELRALGAGKVDAEVTIEMDVDEEGARIDFLASLKVEPLKKDVVELKITGHSLPECPDSAALLQAAGYADLVVRRRLGSVRFIIVCYMSLRDRRMRLFIYRNTQQMRVIAGKLLRN